MARFVAALLILCWTGLAPARAPILDTAGVQAAIQRGALVWDVRHASEYAKGHIPGAVNVGDAAHVLRHIQTEDYLPLEQIERILGAAGIDPAREVVVYGTRGSPNAYFGFKTMQYFGATRAGVYHDGVDGWRAAGLTLSTAPARPTPVALKLTPNPAVVASTEQVLAALKRPGVQILDVRTGDEFRGDDIRAIRGGHVPGAINIPYEENWVEPDTPWLLARRQVPDNRGMALKSESELRKLYGSLDPKKETIVYCQSGVRAAETAAVLTQLGFRDVKVYDSSWLGYAANLAAPVANEVFFNVGLMNSRIGGLHSRIEALERELAEARARR